ncbi:MAG: putative site-specific integrase-resolvase [Candidatus Alkanophagales archaeon MCA70_species_2]|nr:putative site-specific integrase-resolvase [Candidatus Alkanophaga liquidiphilum]
MGRYFRGEASKILGVSGMTLYRWTREGKIRFVRTPGGEYRYPESEIYRILGEQRPQNKAVIYARVSSADQKPDLERQIEALQKFAEKEGLEVLEVITDIASGLDGERKGLKRLYELVKDRKIGKVLITYKDRLTRFGYEQIEEFFESYGVAIICLYRQSKTPHEELVEDLISIVTSFAGELYGMRSHKAKKVIESVKESIRDC